MKTVYFIKAVDMDGPIKIGASNNPTIRKQTLQAWSPFDLEIITSIVGDDLLEARIHAALHEHHHRGEWFRAALPVLAMIDDIRHGRFDPDKLPASMGTARMISARKAKYSPIDWEYIAAYDRFRTTPKTFRAGLGWPTSPYVFSGYSAARKKLVLDTLLGRITIAEKAAA